MRIRVWRESNDVLHDSNNTRAEAVWEGSLAEFTETYPVDPTRFNDFTGNDDWNFWRSQFQIQTGEAEDAPWEDRSWQEITDIAMRQANEDGTTTEEEAEA